MSTLKIKLQETVVGIVVSSIKDITVYAWLLFSCKLFSWLLVLMREVVFWGGLNNPLLYIDSCDKGIIFLGVLGNDSVVGDPLYSVPVYSSNSSLQSVSLCFEVHGAVDKIFNLVSDRCVSVNALYSSMINPNDGNIVTSVGVRAVDISGKCVNIVVSLSEDCVPFVNSEPSLFYSDFGVSVRKRGSKVTVSVPNCENEQLVMKMMCRTIGIQRMLDFGIQRGLNLRPTSHGLLG